MIQKSRLMIEPVASQRGEATKNPSRRFINLFDSSSSRFEGREGEGRDERAAFCLRIDGKVQQVGQGVAQRVDLELEDAQARVGVGANADQMVAHGPNRETVHVAVENEKVQVVRERGAELLERLVDGANDGANVFDVELRVLVLDHVVQVVAGPSGQDGRLDVAIGHLA